MTDKIIDEVMGLIESFGAFCFHGGEGHGDKENTDAAREAIRAKLREVLERKPMQEGEIFNWWRGENGLEDHDMCKLQDFSEVVRAVEKRHNIK